MHAVSFVPLTLRCPARRSGAQLAAALLNTAWPILMTCIMALISVDSRWKYECGSYLAIFSALFTFSLSTLSKCTIVKSVI
jgi:hypothetical protein